MRCTIRKINVFGDETESVLDLERCTERRVRTMLATTMGSGIAVLKSEMSTAMVAGTCPDEVLAVMNDEVARGAKDIEVIVLPRVQAG